ncbi:MAG: hypothetical protein SPL10_01835 [Synergistales bacterium]|nr:hypothetical protein [Synergistales bacterium]MDY6402106.1 hypothetical protein [Synergistales bacterium]MDY6405233.1 hypothetical protein [Synergistales bacterium]MDY6410429.1 hypothetical protein [Synergistales bacterium]MDY6413882.1 hypothetical protein [Synergistales bacterium]
MKKLFLISIFILIVFTLPTMAITEHEFKQICRSGSVQELQTTIASEKILQPCVFMRWTRR